MVIVKLKLFPANYHQKFLTSNATKTSNFFCYITSKISTVIYTIANQVNVSTKGESE